MTIEELQRELDTRDDGVLRHGGHGAGREFCALEFENQLRGRAWSDNPITLPDLRPLNDAQWSSDAARTQAILPVMSALWDYRLWSPAHKTAWYKYVTLRTTQELIVPLFAFLPDIQREGQAIRAFGAIQTWAIRAAWAAEAAGVAGAARAARAAGAAGAARAAEAAGAAGAGWAAEAAWAAGAARATRAAGAASTKVLQAACQIWIDGVEATRDR